MLEYKENLTSSKHKEKKHLHKYGENLVYGLM